MHCLQVSGKRLFQTPSTAGGTDSKVSPTDPFACSRVAAEKVPFPGFGAAAMQDSPGVSNFSFNLGKDHTLLQCCRSFVCVASDWVDSP